MKAAERYRLPALATGVLLAAFWVLTPGLRDALPDPSLQLTALNMLGAAASWLVIVGALGYGRRYLDRTSPALSYLGEASYPVYLLHQTVIVIAAFYVVDLAAAEPLQWLTLMAVSVAATFALYEVVRRARVTRWAFGMKVGRPAGPKQPDAAGRAPGVVAS